MKKQITPRIDWKTFARIHQEHGADWLGEARAGKLPRPDDVQFIVSSDGESLALHPDGRRWTHAPNSVTWQEIRE